MAKYLGEFDVPLKETPFADHGLVEWALFFIKDLGSFDGDHHKSYALDQVARVLHGAPVNIKQARWDSGLSEWRITVGKPTKSYKSWVDVIRFPNGPDGDEYPYDTGTPP